MVAEPIDQQTVVKGFTEDIEAETDILAPTSPGFAFSMGAILLINLLVHKELENGHKACKNFVTR